MRCNLDHLDNLDNLTQNPQQNRLFLDGFKIAALITLIILPSTAPANRQRRPQRTSAALMVNPRRGQSGKPSAAFRQKPGIRLRAHIAPKINLQPQPVVKALAALAALAMMSESIKNTSKIADFTTRPSWPKGIVSAALANFSGAAVALKTCRRLRNHCTLARRQ